MSGGGKTGRSANGWNRILLKLAIFGAASIVGPGAISTVAAFADGENDFAAFEADFEPANDGADDEFEPFGDADGENDFADFETDDEPTNDDADDEFEPFDDDSDTAETTVANVNVDATKGATLTDSSVATGLTGPNGSTSVSTSGTIRVAGGASARVAVLNEKSTSIDDAKSGVALTLDSGGAVVVGDSGSASELGTLVVAGVGTSDLSTLTAKKSSSISIGSGGLLEIGGSGRGEVVLLDGSRLTNAGKSLKTTDSTNSTGSDVSDVSGKADANETLRRGVVVESTGTLVVGTANAKTTGTVLDGDGEFRNFGTVSLFNEAGDAAAIVFGAYSDDANATLTATGTVETKGGVEANGPTTIAGKLTAAAWSNVGSAVLSETSAVDVERLTLETNGATTLTNSGSLDAETLTVEPGASGDSFELVNLAASAKGARIGTLTLGANQTLTNGATGGSDGGSDDATSGAFLNITKAALSGGTFRALGTSTANVGALTVDANDAENAALRTSDSATITVETFELIRGLAVLESNAGAGGLKAASSSATYTIGKDGQDAKDVAELRISGTDATFDGGTLTLAGQGKLVQDADFVLTFDKTAVVNNSALTGGVGAISSDNIVFTGVGASYSGGKTVDASLLTFESGARLDLGLGDDLVLAENGSLVLKDGAILNVEFGADGKTAGKAVVSGGGVAKLETGSVVKAANASALSTGKYSGVAIQTASDASVFDGTGETTAFYRTTTRTSDDGKSLSVDLEVFGNAERFAQNDNQRAVARYVDSIRQNDSLSAPLRRTLDDFADSSDATTAALSLSSLGGAQKANSLALAANSPWRAAFERHYASETGGALDVGGGRGATSRGAWFASTYRGLDARSDGVSDGFGITDVGADFGYEVARDADFSGGLTFGYSKPRLFSGDSRIEAANYRLGLTGIGTSATGWNAKFYVGGGLQDYSSKRIARAGNVENFHRADFDGYSFAAALRLGRSANVGLATTLTPFVQFDVQQIWQNGATETGAGSALEYAKADLNQTFVRVGVEREYSAMFANLNARVAYAYQLAGDSAPESEFRFVGASSLSQSAVVYGVDRGRSYFDVGLGGNGYLDRERRWSIGGDYDFVASKKTTSHVGTLRVAYQF